ncbi:hypothetical protein INH39_24320 [Massilia violaceinigra]|uniref:Stability determinant domain-containing protein n=1 Tax=Massilia violaceinigra TaxID=2045208 RepID=A0ABY4A1B3_9BURK|nr:hypothetical protein [Massilia violaceinigra]UOD28548.1 hypothetical protein INH39_24320 [Massilia violaceinigra]
MATETIDQATLTQLAKSGEVRNARAVGCGTGWNIHVQHGIVERTLVAKLSGDMHVFSSFENVVTFLQGIGIARFDVDAEHYHASPDAGRAGSVPEPDEDDPDSYDEWLCAEVEASIDDPDPGLPHDEAMRQIRAAVFTD